MAREPSSEVKMLHVEVVYAAATQQAILSVILPEGACVGDAIGLSGILDRFPELTPLEQLKDRVGIFGERTSLDHPLQAQDRVEIYRTLPCDPKAARRVRALKARFCSG